MFGGPYRRLNTCLGSLAGAQGHVGSDRAGIRLRAEAGYTHKCSRVCFDRGNKAQTFVKTCRFTHVFPRQAANASEAPWAATASRHVSQPILNVCMGFATHIVEDEFVKEHTGSKQQQHTNTSALPATTAANNA